MLTLGRAAGLACLAAATGFANPAEAATLVISGGTPSTTIPQGSSGNSVLGQAGVGFAGGRIWTDARLQNQGDIALTLYDVGSESAWKNQIRLLNSTGTSVSDNDNHGAGSSGVFVNGSPPFQRVRSFTQNSGLTNIRIWRKTPTPEIRILINGQSPSSVPDSGQASFAFAYLDETYQIVNEPTNRVLVLVEDGSGADRDYDDYVGILQGPPVDPPPPIDPPLASISGGNAVDAVPQGNSGNSVVAQAGIGFAGGRIWVDGTLDVLGNGAVLTLFDVGSESHWINEIRLDNNAGNPLLDWDDHFRGDTDEFVNGTAPFQVAGSVSQPSGVAGFEFRRIDPAPEYQTVVNGQSPMMQVPGYGFASIALAYLSDTNHIVSDPTNRILVLLEDGGADRDYDDYVGILALSTATPPNNYPVSPNALVFGEVPRNTISSARTVTIRNTGTAPLPIGPLSITGGNPSQFTRTNHCPASLAVGASCTVSVFFKPTLRGTRQAVLNIATGSSVRVVGLFGSGT